MRLVQTILNGMVEDLGEKLSGGTLELYDGARPSSPSDPVETFRDPLAVLVFQSPAFTDVVDASAKALIDSGGTRRDGDVTWGRLVMRGGAVLGDVVVRRKDAPDASDADIRLDFTDLRTNRDVVKLTDLVLKLPVR